MEALPQKHEDIVIRKVDISSWSSPVAAQYRIRGIPALWLYDGTKLVSADTNQVLDTLF